MSYVVAGWIGFGWSIVTGILFIYLGVMNGDDSGERLTALIFTILAFLTSYALWGLMP